MTRAFSPRGIPTAAVAAYYRRRAEGGAGLIFTEGTWIPHPSASNDENVPCFYGEEALQGWSNVLREVHAAGGRIIPQLWHAGLVEKASPEAGKREGVDCGAHQIGPSGYAGGAGKLPRMVSTPMTQKDIDGVIDAYASAAESAMRLGFDGVAIHGAHGYLIDQFFWANTNIRVDRYGGDIANRSRFAVDIIRECKRRTGKGFPLVLRLSQWKLQDFAAKLVATPDELSRLILPLVDAGVDLFDCSQRKYWEPEFSESHLNLAGWVKKISGKPTMTVGSVGLLDDLSVDRLDRLMEMFDRAEFDLVAVARGMLADPEWTMKMREGQYERIRSFDRKLVGTLW